MGDRLAEKVAIVVGAGQNPGDTIGNGRAISILFAREGARVLLVDCRIDSALQTKEMIDREGGKALAFEADITKEADCRALAERCVEVFGRIDILVNNAALFGDLVKKPFWEIPVNEWDKVMAVNLKGPFLCAKAVYPQMKKQGKGKIINVSSGTFYKGLPNFLHYVVSKGGNVALSRSMAREVGDAGINVNTIAPGYTETEFLKENPQDPPEVRKMTVGSRCMKRPETPEDLTGTIVFLSSDDSDFITGQTILVDGGSALN